MLVVVCIMKKYKTLNELIVDIRQTVLRGNCCEKLKK